MRESQNRIGSKTAYPYDVFRLDVVDWCGGLSRFGPCRLYPPAISTISWHIKGVLESGELDADSTVAFFSTVQKEGARQIERQIAYYNLDMIISVGYAKII